MSFSFMELIQNLWNNSGIINLTWQHLLMICISFVLIYFAISKKYEPLLLLPIAFGILLINLPNTGLMDAPNEALNVPGGILYYLYQGVKTGIFPSIIFLGIGAMTDFGPLIARPSGFLLGFAAQIGIVLAFLLAQLIGFNLQDAASISIIGGADGPTAIFLTAKLSPHLLPAITIAAYSYMAIIPIIQPPLIRLLTTREQRKVEMKQLRDVSKKEKILFPIVVTIIVVLFIPSAAPLIGMLMMGNLFKESGVVERFLGTIKNSLINTSTIFLGVTIGATASGDAFLALVTLKIILLGLIAFILSTVGGLLMGNLMYQLSGGNINPIIGAAGVSAVPMAARVVQLEGLKANPSNFLIMHAIGPNVSGIIGSAMAAGIFVAIFG